MYLMTNMMDYLISPHPIKIAELKIDESKLKVRHMTINQVGYLPGRTLRRDKVSFPHWALVFITSGEGTLQIKDKEVHKIVGGTFFFVYPGTHFSFGPIAGGHWDEYYIRFSGSQISDWLETGLLFKNPITVGKKRNQQYIHDAERIYHYIESGIALNADRAALLFESFLLELYADIKEEETVPVDTFKKVTEYLKKNHKNIQNAEEIAFKCYISLSTLRRIIKQNTGYPLNEYWHLLKIEEAKRLIMGTDLTISEISNYIGYKDPYYFSRVFKKFTKTSPSNYEKQSGCLK
jgi:AraC family transcriptional regulator of arabinose operon